MTTNEQPNPFSWYEVGVGMENSYIYLTCKVSDVSAEAAVDQVKTFVEECRAWMGGSAEAVVTAASAGE